ncbi:MAG: Peptidylprolyl isomerase [Myxococcales bacterium]|nr:Peptidylprolyl isomerase [Myxococcales bacterium]
MSSLQHRLGATLFALLAITACEKKTNKAGDMGGTSGSTAAASDHKPGEEMAPEPVGRDPKQPSPNPAPAGEDVRPPVAADFAEYTKDLKGSGKLLATIETSMGTFHCELFGDKVPMTVANFVGLATGKKPWMNPKTGNVERGKPYYDGLIFHRVIPKFMIQGGDPLGQGVGGPGYEFADEIVPELKMAPGVLAMANTGQPVTNGGQFFITEISPDWLNGHHTVFGQCQEVDLVKKITGVPATNERPNEPVTINKVTISKG